MLLLYRVVAYRLVVRGESVILDPSLRTVVLGRGGVIGSVGGGKANSRRACFLPYLSGPSSLADYHPRSQEARRSGAPMSTVERIGSLVGALLLLLTACGASGPSTAGGAAAGQQYVSGPGTVTRVSTGERGSAPGVQGRLLDGGTFDLAAHRGKVVVFNVWGSWCPPCRAEAPGLQRVWEETRAKGVQFVGINTRDTVPAARAFERRFGITYPSVVDDDGRLLLAFRGSLPPNAIPSTIILDSESRVAARVVGATTYEKLRRLVDDVLAEKA